MANFVAILRNVESGGGIVGLRSCRQLPTAVMQLNCSLDGQAQRFRSFKEWSTAMTYGVSCKRCFAHDPRHFSHVSAQVFDVMIRWTRNGQKNATWVSHNRAQIATRLPDRNFRSIVVWNERFQQPEPYCDCHSSDFKKGNSAVHVCQ